MGSAPVSVDIRSFTSEILTDVQCITMPPPPPPLHVPQSVTLTPTETGKATGTLHISNACDNPILISVDASDSILVSPAEITLPPGGHTALDVICHGNGRPRLAVFGRTQGNTILYARCVQIDVDGFAEDFVCRAPWPDPFGMESEEDICNSWSTDRSGGTGSSSLCEAVVNRAEMTDCEVTLFRLGGHALLEERGANGYTAALVPAGMCGKWYDGALRNGANALKGRHAHARRRVWTMLLSDVAVASSETVRWVQRDLKQIYVSILAITFAAPLVYALVQAVKIVCARRLYTGMFEYGVIREGDVEIGCISGRRRFRRDELDCVRVVEKGVEFVYGGVETVLWIEETYSKWVAERLDGLVESERGKRMFDDAGRAHASRRVLRDTVLPESGADSEIWLRRRGTHVRIVHMRNGAGVFLTHIAFVWAIWVAYMAANVAVKTRAGEERFWHDVIEIALLVVFVLLTPFVCGRFVRTWCVGRGHVCEKDLEVVREKVVDRGRCVGGNRYGCVLACGHGRVAEVGGLTRGDAGRVAKAVRGVVAGAAEDGEEV